MPNVRRQRGAAPASCARLQPRQFPADSGDAGADQGLVTDDLEGEAHQDRREGREPRPLRCLPDGRGRHPTANVPGDFAAHRRTAAAATTSASMRRPMVMRSGATDGRSASKCQGKWTHHAAQRPSGRLERRRRSAWRPMIAEKPEKREHSHQVRIHPANSGLNVSEGYPAMRLVGIRKSAMGLVNTTLARFGWHLSPANAIPNLQRQVARGNGLQVARMSEVRTGQSSPRIRGCQGCVEARVLPRRFRAFNVHKSARRGHVAWLVKWPRHRGFSG